MRNDDKELEQRVRATLDDSVTHLDAATRARLSSMRAAALERKPLLPRWLSPNGWMPATALAAGIVFAVVIVFAPSVNESPGQLAMQDTDLALELLLNEDSQDESGDPDFYVWLDAVLLEEEESGNAT